MISMRMILLSWMGVDSRNSNISLVSHLHPEITYILHIFLYSAFLSIIVLIFQSYIVKVTRENLFRNLLRRFITNNHFQKIGAWLNMSFEN